MPRVSFILGILFLWGVCLFPENKLQASETSLPAASAKALFAGEFLSKEDIPTATAVIEEAIERAVKEMNFITRPIARRKLKRTTKPCAKMSFQFTETTIAGHCVEYGSPVVTPDGGSADWTMPDGEVMKASQRLQGLTIEQVFHSKDGMRTNLYEVSPDGNLVTMRSKVESDRLAAPVQFVLHYTRISAK